MTKILCPTRGGEASYHTQDIAIAKSKEQNKPLVFLYVVDTHFLDRTHRAVRPDVVADEMANMGEFLLAMAQERAEQQGIQAEVRIRQGEFHEELIAVAQEEEASLILLGHPAGAESTFKLASLESFAQQIEQETGIKTQIV